LPQKRENIIQMKHIIAVTLINDAAFQEFRDIPINVELSSLYVVEVNELEKLERLNIVNEDQLQQLRYTYEIDRANLAVNLLIDPRDVDLDSIKASVRSLIEAGYLIRYQDSKSNAYPIFEKEGVILGLVYYHRKLRECKDGLIEQLESAGDLTAVLNIPLEWPFYQ
jgi:DNA-binding MarR family transcriptional regulator